MDAGPAPDAAPDRATSPAQDLDLTINLISPAANVELKDPIYADLGRDTMATILRTLTEILNTVMPPEAVPALLSIKTLAMITDELQLLWGTEAAPGPLHGVRSFRNSRSKGDFIRVANEHMRQILFAERARDGDGPAVAAVLAKFRDGVHGKWPLGEPVLKLLWARCKPLILAAAPLIPPAPPARRVRERHGEENIGGGGGGGGDLPYDGQVLRLQRWMQANLDQLKEHLGRHDADHERHNERHDQGEAKGLLQDRLLQENRASSLQQYNELKGLVQDNQTSNAGQYTELKGLVQGHERRLDDHDAQHTDSNAKHDRTRADIASITAEGGKQRTDIDALNASDRRRALAKRGLPPNIAIHACVAPPGPAPPLFQPDGYAILPGLRAELLFDSIGCWDAAGLKEAVAQRWRLAHLLPSHTVVLLMGASGCGKTTVAQALKVTLGCPPPAPAGCTYKSYEISENGQLQPGAQVPTLDTPANITSSRSATVYRWERQGTTSLTIVDMPGDESASDRSKIATDHDKAAVRSSNEIAKMLADVHAEIPNFAKTYQRGKPSTPYKPNLSLSKFAKPVMHLLEPQNTTLILGLFGGTDEEYMTRWGAVGKMLQEIMDKI
ncbi:hypothetical protein DFH27DRAFT_656767 [Peziza echinospora]|nr:hypothetical protein DFH27DRAFT_656767 [Peziza echinospora]